MNEYWRLSKRLTACSVYGWLIVTSVVLDHSGIAVRSTFSPRKEF